MNLKQQTTLIDEFVAAERSADPAVAKAVCEAVCDVQPVTLKRLHEFLAAAEDEPHISLRLRHLLWVGVDLVVTHLFPMGADTHAKLAITHGATPQQLIEVMEMASYVSASQIRPGLLEVREAIAARELDSIKPEDASDADRQLKEQYQNRLGFWEDWMDITLKNSSRQLQAYLELGFSEAHPDGLDEKERELTFLALYSCPAIVDSTNVRRHAERAISAGATEGELYQTLHLANCIAMHSLTSGVGLIPKENIK